MSLGCVCSWPGVISSGSEPRSSPVALGRWSMVVHRVQLESIQCQDTIEYHNRRRVQGNSRKWETILFAGRVRDTRSHNSWQQRLVRNKLRNVPNNSII